MCFIENVELFYSFVGGKLKVVEYLLAECSADPLAKDEMGCVPSDLTMDSEILKTINAFADELNLRKDLERIAGHEAENQMTLRKRNTFDFEMIENTNGTLSRAQSTLLTSNETVDNVQNRILPIIGGNKKTSTASNNYDNYSVTVEKSPTKQPTTNPFESYTERRASSASGGSEQSSPPLIRYYSNGKRTPSLRDSGVFDDEPDMDSLTDQMIKKKLSSISQPEHYNTNTSKLHSSPTKSAVNRMYSLK